MTDPVDVTTEELARRLGEEGLTVLDVRTLHEYTGELGHHCDPRQGHVPGARNVRVEELLALPTVEAVRELVDLPEGSEIVAYCHSGSRSEMVAVVLRAAGYEARNYRGSWHEWSRDESLPLET